MNALVIALNNFKMPVLIRWETIKQAIERVNEEPLSDTEEDDLKLAFLEDIENTQYTIKFSNYCCILNSKTKLKFLADKYKLLFFNYSLGDALILISLSLFFISILF